MKQKWIDKKFYENKCPIAAWEKFLLETMTVIQSQPPPTWVDDVPAGNPWLFWDMFSRSLQGKPIDV